MKVSLHLFWYLQEQEQSACTRTETYLMMPRASSRPYIFFNNGNLVSGLSRVLDGLEA